MAPPYPFQSTLVQQIANRLYDPAMVFWTSAELGVYLNEALRTWNALTSYWRNDFTFQSQAQVTWYDLTNTTTMPNTLRPLTVLDTDIYTAMQLHLLEPPTGINPWPANGSAQFTANDFLNAVQRRRDEILSFTGCTMTRRTVPATNGRITLPFPVYDVRRMAYLPAALQPIGYGLGRYGKGPYGFAAYRMTPASRMWPDDTWAEQSYNFSYNQNPPGTPLVYMMSTQPPISFDTDCPPGGAGVYEIIDIEGGTALSVGVPSTLSLPDDWTHVIKWGALADLLSRESNSKDIPRAQYCEQRYRLGMAALMAAPALLAMRIGNVSLLIDSVEGADLYDTSWQGGAYKQPTKALHMGLNLLALANTPDTSNYSFTATVVQNAPVPTQPSSIINITSDELDCIIDYAQHLAAFKQGGDEFARTMPLFQRFLKQAAIYNGKLLELGEYTSMLLDVSQRERDNNPLMTPDAEQVGGS
jgi:hypothetical protein